MDRFTVPALGLNEHFDTIVNSFNEKLLKSDNNGELFFRQLRGDIGDAILVDNSVSICELFESLGGTARHVTDETPAEGHLVNLRSSISAA